MMRPNHEPILYRIIRKTVDLVYPEMELEGVENIPEEACIVVGNHAQTNGPISSEIRLPFDHYTWCACQMMDWHEVADYAFEDFWSEKPASIRWLYRIISWLIVVPAVYVMGNARTIPVYRDNRCITTFRRSMEKLEEGQSLVIFPECKQEYNKILYAFQDRFIDLAKLYYKRTGKTLSFVPMYLAPKLKKIVFGQPIRFDPTLPFPEERQRICRQLMDTITSLAAAQPLHTVIPYRNIPKDQYPKNRNDLPADECAEKAKASC